MKLEKSILRVFEVRAKPGNGEALKRKLSDTSVTVVDGKPGNLGYFFGKVLCANQDDFIFVSMWKDLESIRALFGETWEQSFLPEGYSELIESCSIKHIEVEGRFESTE
ncbi:MAG: antibiotic biosynthesis monooxygenase [Pseudomonadota bacterium]